MRQTTSWSSNMRPISWDQLCLWPNFIWPIWSAQWPIWTFQIESVAEFVCAWIRFGQHGLWSICYTSFHHSKFWIIYHNIFNFSKKESVKLFIGLGRLDLPHVIMVRRVSFYNHLWVTNNSALSDLVWSYLHDYFKVYNYLSSVFKPTSAAKWHVYELLYQYVNNWFGLNNAHCQCHLVVPFIYFYFFCFFVSFLYISALC